MSQYGCVVLAALLGFAPGLCYSQNKPASQLISKSALETITGYKLDDPQEQKVEDDWLPFRSLPRVMSSSACAYPISASDNRKLDGHVDLAVWYMPRTDEEHAKDIFADQLESNSQRRDPVDGLGCPAIFNNFFLYVFKSSANGLMLLRICAPRDTRDAQMKVEKLNSQIALGVLSTFEKLANVVPVDQIAEPEEALKSQTAMSVVISIHGHGAQGIREPDLRAQIVPQLEKLGITVFPRNDPPKFPILWLNVRTVSRERTVGTGATAVVVTDTVYSLTLFFDQLFPIKTDGAAKFVEARTWTSSWFGLEGQGKLQTLVGDFATAYRKANGK